MHAELLQQREGLVNCSLGYCDGSDAEKRFWGV